SCITVECDADSVGLFDRTFHLSYGLKACSCPPELFKVIDGQ
ncbi:unnamed protein product, partial [Urochloa humidicola]